MNFKGFLFDLDGVFYISEKIIPGGKELLNFLKTKNMPYRFVTNTTTKSRKKLYKKLSKIGLPIYENEIFSACYAGVLKLRELKSPKVRLIIMDDAKLEFDEFEIDNINPEYIVIGDLDRDWNFEIINSIFNQVMNGAKILALHKGRYFKTDEGLQIDSGAFIKGIEYATTTKSIVVGKPNPDFFKLALKDLSLRKEEVAMVGDDLINDIQGAQQFGLYSILTKTGKFNKEKLNSSKIFPDLIIDSIADISKFI